MPRFTAQRLLVFLIAGCSVLLFIRVIVYGPVLEPEAIRKASGKLTALATSKLDNRKRGGHNKFGVFENEDPPDKCEYDSTCTFPNIAVRVGAETYKRPPFGCLNDIRVFEPKDLKKGINVAVLNGETAVIERMVSFDVSNTDEKLIHWLRSFRSHQVIVVVSFGDVAEKISLDARNAFSLFGAEKIKNWRHGDAYVLFGQWGLEIGAASEMMMSLMESPSINTFNSELGECIFFPLGKLRNVTQERDVDLVNRVDESKLAEFREVSDLRERVHLGVSWDNCGKDVPCAYDEIPMHFYSGQNKDDAPRMCIAERYVFAHGLNSAGRGLNIAVVDPKSKSVTRVGHFDTYEQESTGLERFLDLIEPGEIVAVVSFDEASSMLSYMAKNIFYELGSSMIERIKFRAAWFFVGQKGINAFTPFEDLNFPTGNNWAAPVKTWICVPKSLSGKKGPPIVENVRRQNIPKRHFCAKYDGHDHFCSDEEIDKPITPRPLSDKGRTDNPIFNVPIVVVAGLSMNALRRSLSSLLDQEGVNTQMILTVYNKEYKQAADMASLFHSTPVALNTSSDYNELLFSAISAGLQLFPKAKSIIVVEEEVVLSPDFLSTFSQLHRPFLSDMSLSYIQAFNYNGFKRSSGDATTIYRVENQPPVYAFEIKRIVFEEQILPRKNDCCHTAHWWSVTPSVSLVPALSRVAVIPPSQFEEQTSASIFDEPRIVSNTTFQKLDVMSIVSDDSYENVVLKMDDNSLKSTFTDWSDCGVKHYKTFLQKLSAEKTLKKLLIEYKTANELEQLLKCFGVLNFPKFIPGKSGRLTRFSIDGLPVVVSQIP